jgi:hypothetical protein
MMTEPRNAKPAAGTGGLDSDERNPDETSHAYSTSTTPEVQQRELALWHLARATAGASDYDLDLIRDEWPDAPTEGSESLIDWLKDNPAVTTAVARIDPESPPPARPTRVDSFTSSNTPEHAPPLPEYAQLSRAQIDDASQAGRWLDDYITFASEASPLTPLSFHQAAGLFAGSLAIARRLRLEVSTSTIYPNLYLLFVGRSTLPRKSTGLNVLRGLLREADMQHFLLAGRQTPEALTLDLSTRVPPSYGSWASDEQEMWLRERAFAGQRGWLLEEASHLLDSFERDYSGGLLPIVLDLYDCSDRGPARNTIDRGRERVKQPYLSIFGATTFGAMIAHLNNDAHWHNGLWARFALVTTDGAREWKFWPPSMDYPKPLVERLRFVAHDLLPVPEVTESDDGAEVEALQGSAVAITSQAWEQWELYSKAVTYDMLCNELADPSKLDANYGRFPTMLIKVAMILAALDTQSLPVKVEGKHVYRAQTITEGWRDSLHPIIDRSIQKAQEDLTTRFLAVLDKNPGEWSTRREVLRALKLKADDLQPVAASLKGDGVIEIQEYKPPSGPSSVRYRRSTDE